MVTVKALLSHINFQFGILIFYLVKINQVTSQNLGILTGHQNVHLQG